MKSTEKLFYFVFILACLGFSSCREETEEERKQKENNYVNHWIYDEMSTYYFWNDHIPARPDFRLNPKDFFESICYWYDEDTNPDGDRFSWIQENFVDLMNSLSGVNSDEIGFEFMLYAISEKGDIVGEIQYIKENTPAQHNGLKRGQFFTEINGITLTRSNYYELLTGLKGDFSITLHDVYVNDDGFIELMTPEVKSISTVPNYADYPIFLDTVYTINNKNIGYLVYNFFADDPNNGTLKYDIDLANVFSKFQQENVNNMIVDLRYNSGGSSQASAYLASMLVKNLSAQHIFLKAEYNSIVTQAIIKQKEESILYLNFAEKITTESAQYPIPNIGDNLQNLIILTGQNTASASEMVINGLKPYMDVTLLGDTTVGKNVGSQTFYDEGNTKKNKWGIQPIIIKLYNSDNQSDFTAGFIPDILDLDYYFPKYDLGDLREGMLSNAIGYITGSSALRSSFVEPKQSSLRLIDSSIAKKMWTNKIIMPANSLPQKE